MNAPKLRFNKFDDEWFEKKLGSVCSFSKGKDLSKADLNESGQPCILYGELYTKYGPVVNAVVSRTEKKSNSLIKANRYDVLIPSSGETAIDIACASSLNVDDVLIGGDLNILTPSFEINGHFLSYQINGKRKYKLSTLAQGATVTHLYADSIKKLSCFFPSYEEQKTITSFLQLIDKKIQLQQEKIDLLKEQKKGYMQKIFNQQLRFKDENGEIFPHWSTNSLNNFAIINPKTESLEERFRYIDLEAVNDGELLSTCIISKQNAPSRAQRVISKGDILYQTVRPYQKNNLLYDFDFIEQVVASTGYAQLKAKENVLSSFLYQYLNTEKFTYYVLQRCTGTSYPAINSSDLGEIEIRMPVLKEQKKISSFLSKLDEKISLEKNYLNVLSQQKQAFMQQMFI